MLACQHQYCYHKKIEQDTEEEVGDASGHLKPSLIVAELLDAPVHNTSNGQLRHFLLVSRLVNSLYIENKLNLYPLCRGRLLSPLQVSLVAVMFYHLICVQRSTMNSDC